MNFAGGGTVRPQLSTGFLRGLFLGLADGHLPAVSLNGLLSVPCTLVLSPLVMRTSPIGLDSYPNSLILT